MLLSALGTLRKSLLSGRKKKKSKSGKEMSQQVLNRSSKEEEKSVIKPQNSLVPLSLKTTTIPTANLITTKEDSIKDKLLMIKDLLGLQLKFRLSSWSQKMKNMMEERRKKREKELEEKKEKKKKSPFLNVLPKTGILDSLKNFLAFLAGGFLLNLLLNYLPVLKEIGKKLAPIAKGVMQFGKFMWEGVIGFIVKAYDGYDELRKSIERIGGEDALEKFDKVSDLLKKVINGALIMAAIALVAKPFMPKGPGGKGPGGPTPVTPVCNCAPVPVTVPQLVTATAITLQTIIGGALIPGAVGLLQKLIEGLIPTNEQISGNDVKVPDTVPVDLPVVPDTTLVDLPVDQDEFQKLYERAVYAVETLSAGEKQFLIDNGFEDLIKGSIKGDIFGELATLGVAYSTVQASILGLAKTMSFFGALKMPVWAKTLLAGGGATILTPNFAAAEELDKNVPNYTVMGIEYDGNTGLPVPNQDLDKTGSDDDTPTLKITVIGKKSTPRITQWWDLDDEPNFMKNVISVDDLAQDTSYSNGSYGLITNNITVIQPVIQEV